MINPSIPWQLQKAGQGQVPDDGYLHPSLTLPGIYPQKKLGLGGEEGETGARRRALAFPQDPRSFLTHTQSHNFEKLPKIFVGGLGQNLHRGNLQGSDLQ